MTTLIYLFIQSFSNVSSQKISFARILSISALVSLLHPFLFYDIVSASAKPATDEALRKTQELQMPFIANEGQTDERVRFYANTAGGAVFVIKDGEIVYVLPKYEEKAKDVHHEAHEENTNVGRRDSSLLTYSNKSMEYGCNLAERGMAAWGQDENNPLNPPLSRGTKCEIRNPKSTGGVMLKEEIVGGRISTVKGEGESFTKVSYFKGNDPSKWKDNISTYAMVNLGEVYEGIELKLKAYGNNVEKLFYVKPGADPNQIKISLSGLQSPECNEKLPPESPFIKGDFLSPAIQAVQTGVGRKWMHPIESRDITKSPLEKGARGLSVNEDGQLVAETALGLVKFTKPIAYQMIDGKRVEVECEYVIAECGGICPQNTQKDTKMDFLRPFESFRGLSELLYSKSKSQNVNSEFQDMKSEIQNLKSEYGFKVASYDTTKELIIDPLLASTFLGRSDTYSNAIAIDMDGNIYVTGYTNSPDFPTTPGVYDTSHNGADDVFITKLNSTLTNVLASTYLGGTLNTNISGGSDQASSIAIDSLGNICITGITNAADFPTTPGAYDTLYDPSIHTAKVFVSKLNGNLSGILASTYLGGGWEQAKSIAIDKDDNIYITGYTASSNFPTTENAYDTTFADNVLPPGYWQYDAFISKFDRDLKHLTASTFLGGEYQDFANALTLDKDGNIYVTGGTRSRDFPATPDAYDIVFEIYSNQAEDVFISKFNGELTTLLASTSLGGGNFTDEAKDIALDMDGSVYVTGVTYCAQTTPPLPCDFPTTEGAYDTTAATDIAACDAFVSKLSGDLKSLIVSTLLGGLNGEDALSIAINANGNIHIIGSTYSPDFPSYENLYNDTGYPDAFVSEFNNNLSDLVASTCLGGNSYDYGNSLAADKNGNIFVAGWTMSTDFPSTPGAYDTSAPSTTSSGRAYVSRYLTCTGELLIADIYPKTGGDNGLVSVRISGCQFQDGVTVRLTRAGRPDIEGAMVTLKGNNYVNAIFNLAGKERGVRDVVVKNPDGSSAILENSFTIEAGKAYNVWVDMPNRAVVRIGGYTSPFIITYGNSGNTDALGVPLCISFPKDTYWQLTSEIKYPPQRAGGDPVDWSEVPIHIEREKDIVIPLFLPIIREGQTGMIRMKSGRLG